MPPAPVDVPTTTHLLMSSAQARPGLQALPAMQAHSSSPGVQLDAPPLPVDPPLPPVPVLGCPHEHRQQPAGGQGENRNPEKTRSDTHGKGGSLAKTRNDRNDPETIGSENGDQAAVGAGAFVVSVRKSYFRDFQIVPSR